MALKPTLRQYKSETFQAQFVKPVFRFRRIYPSFDLISIENNYAPLLI